MKIGNYEKNGIIPESFYAFNPIGETTHDCKICGEPLEDDDKFEVDGICDECAEKLKDEFNAVIGKAIKDNFTKEEWHVIEDIIYDGTHLLEYFEY